MTGLESRLESCERSLRRLRFAVLGGPLLSLALFAGGATTDAPPDLRARSVTVVDDAGRPQIVLTGEATGGRVRLLGASGLLAAELHVTGAGGRAVVYDARGRVAVVAGSDPNGGTLSVASRGAALVVRARADEKGNGTLTTWDGRENARTLTPTGLKRPARRSEREEGE